MYRFTYEEYFPESWNLRSMAPAVDYERVRQQHIKSMPIDATDDAEAADKAKKFIEDSKKTNPNGWPHTAIELVKVISLK